MAEELVPIDPKFLPPENQELQTDLDYVRKNQQELIEAAKTGLVGIMDVADQSQHPRAYEVLSQFLKTASELNKDLIATAQAKAFAKDVGTKEEDNGNITNNLFVGTPAELQEMLEMMQTKKNE